MNIKSTVYPPDYKKIDIDIDSSTNIDFFKWQMHIKQEHEKLKNIRHEKKELPKHLGFFKIEKTII